MSYDWITLYIIHAIMINIQSALNSKYLNTTECHYVSFVFCRQLQLKITLVDVHNNWSSCKNQQGIPILWSKIQINCSV